PLVPADGPAERRGDRRRDRRLPAHRLRRAPARRAGGVSAYSVSRALVTGAARGIGAATARRLAQEGLSVALLDLDRAGAEETAAAIAAEAGATAVGIECYVTDRLRVEAAVAEAAESPGGLDRLMANGG